MLYSLCLTFVAFDAFNSFANRCGGKYVCPTHIKMKIAIMTNYYSGGQVQIQVILCLICNIILHYCFYFLIYSKIMKIYCGILMDIHGEDCNTIFLKMEYNSSKLSATQHKFINNLKYSNSWVSCLVSLYHICTYVLQFFQIV